MPKSYAQIYGLLFISPRPLSMEGLIERLQISRGSVSQGLKFLRNIGAVKMVDYNGERSMHYVAMAELRKLSERFLKNEILPRIADSEQKLLAINRSITRLPVAERKKMESHIFMLQSWTRTGQRVLPLLMKLLD